MNRFPKLVLGISRGIARDQFQRRRAMSALLIVSLTMLAIGTFPLWNIFPTHPRFFAFYWLICAWFTTCAALLAIYDFLLVIRRGREDRAAARRRIFQDPD